MNRNKMLFQKVKDLKLALGTYALFGSAPLGIRNLRECNDVDIITSKELFELCKLNGQWQYSIKNNSSESLSQGDIELFYKWSSDDFKVDKMISEAEIIDGLPFVKLQTVLRWKKASQREKDLVDVKIIENYLKNSI